jgi:hypothetical protein
LKQFEKYLFGYKNELKVYFTVSLSTYVVRRHAARLGERDLSFAAAASQALHA